MRQPYLDRHRYVPEEPPVGLGLLNCERIADRRHIHGWRVEPHYHDGLTQLFFFLRGDVQALLDYEASTIVAPALVWMPALVGHGFDYPEGAEGWVLTLASGVAARLGNGLRPPGALHGKPEVLCGAALAPEMPHLPGLFQVLEAESGGFAEARDIAVEALFRLILVHMQRGLSRAAAATPSQPDRRFDLVRRFDALVERDHAKHRAVADFAAELGVTPTHLSRTVKAVTGRTAGEVVHDRLLLEARRQLVFSDAPISDIAWQLNFSTPTYFTRFFSGLTGETPSVFRARMRARPDDPV